MVDHPILLSKIHLYKFSRSTIKWFESYLSNSQEAIAFNNGLSDFEHVRSGVPQGSILGPTLFLIFINDLPLTLKHCKSDFYSDDATVNTHSKDLHVIEKGLQSDFVDTIQWSKDHKMQIQYIKTTCMTVGTNKRVGGIPSITN